MRADSSETGVTGVEYLPPLNYTVEALLGRIHHYRLPIHLNRVQPKSKSKHPETCLGEEAPVRLVAEPVLLLDLTLHEPPQGVLLGTILSLTSVLYLRLAR